MFRLSASIRKSSREAGFSATSRHTPTLWRRNLHIRPSTRGKIHLCASGHQADKMHQRTVHCVKKRWQLEDYVWNMMAHAQKPDFVFRRNGRVHLNRRGRQFSRLMAAEVCGSAVVMLDTPRSEVVWRVLATHRPKPLDFSGVKILSMPSSGGEVKESVPCPSFAACKTT